MTLLISPNCFKPTVKLFALKDSDIPTDSDYQAPLFGGRGSSY